MLFSILIYGDEAINDCLPEDVLASAMAKHVELQEKFEVGGRLLGTAKLMPSSSAVVVTSGEPDLVTDGPFAETKEQFLGFYLLDCEDIEEAIEAAKLLSFTHHRFEVRGVEWLGGNVSK